MATRTPRPAPRLHPAWRRPRSTLLTVVLALLAGGITARVVARAEATAEAFGDGRRVPVATHVIDAGRVIAADDVAWRELPLAALPDAEPVDNPVGRVALAAILGGEPVVTARVAPDGARDPSAIVPAGGRALAVPTDDPHPVVRVGDHVDLQAGSVTVARSAVVVDVDDHALTVAVSGREVAATAQALLESRVIVALVGAR
jgi:Flp pilus assembly protein CpaB